MTPTLLMGGAERWLVSLARSSDRQRIAWTGTALTDCAPTSAGLCREMSALMPIFAGPCSGGPGCDQWIVRCRSAREAVQRAVADADVLITWGVPQLAEITADLSIPVVFVAHGGCGWSRQVAGSSEAGATHFVAVSEAALNAFSADVRRRAVVIHNGVDVARCAPQIGRARVRAAWGFSERERLIGYVGRYSGEKYAEAAALAVAALGEPYRAVYAGEGWMEDSLRATVHAIAGDRARFVPMDRQVGNILHALDAFVLASPSEGFSLALAEAWYCGVPTVATRVGAVPELERVHGQLVASVPMQATAGDLAGAVQSALSPTFQSTVVHRARETVVRHFTAGVLGRRWTEYLGSIVSERSARRSHWALPGRWRDTA